MPPMRRSFSAMTILLFLFNLVVAQPAQAAPDRTIRKVALTGARNAPIEAWITRSDAEDGSLVVKLIEKGVGPRPQSITLYRGGGGDDGPGSSDFRDVTAKVVELPMAGKVVRVDFSFQVPGTAEEKTETTLIGFSGKTHRLIQVETRHTRQKNQNCGEVEETRLIPDGDEMEGRLVTERHIVATPALGDEDEPLDLTCVSTKAERKVYRFNGDKYLETNEPAASPQPSPSPAPVSDD
jgi:hypothetical protein